MCPTLIRLFRAALPAVLFAGWLASARAQGGPPMITDDPGTPGNGHWEINLGWTTESAPGSTLVGAPSLDANYGLGDRIELTYDATWEMLRDGDGSRAGVGDSLIGAKWRFYDAGDQGWQVSVYPQVTFLNPGSHSDRRGLSDGATTVLLPLEFEHDLGPLSVNFDGGRVMSSAGWNAPDAGWMGGVVVGRQVTKTWELDVETHVNASSGFDRSEWIVNAGTRIDFSDSLTLMIALGRDLSNRLGPRASLMSYAGFQLRL